MKRADSALFLLSAKRFGAAEVSAGGRFEAAEVSAGGGPGLRRFRPEAVRYRKKLMRDYRPQKPGGLIDPETYRQ